MNDYKPSKIEDFYLNDISINNINLWKKKYDKPLFIYGETGCGKSTLSNIIVNNSPNILIDISYIKNIKKINDIIDKSIETNCVLSFFNNKKESKILIFDDLQDFYNNDKINFNNLLKIFNKLKKIKYPIIIIASNIKPVKINNLYTKAFKVSIKYNNDIYKKIVNKYFNKCEYNHYNYNINQMKNDILFNSNIDRYDKINNIDNIFNNNLSIDYVITYYYESYYISQILLTNIIYLSNSFEDILYIYNYQLLSDIFFNNHLRVYNIIFSIYPFLLVKLNKKELKNNKYLNDYYKLLKLKKTNLYNPLSKGEQLNKLFIPLFNWYDKLKHVPAL